MEKHKVTEYIKSFLPFDCQISFKDSRSHIIFIKKRLFVTKINIHPIFLEADKCLIHDIINFILRKNKSTLALEKKNITDFYNEKYKPKKIRIKKSFKAVNIFQIFSEIIEALKLKYTSIEFSELNIAWGKHYKNQTRSIRFGSFDKRHNLIRIHPKLDSLHIPDYFIKSVIIHEIAHFIAHKLYKNIKPHSRKFHDIVIKIDPYLKQGKIWEKKNKHIFFTGYDFEE